MGKVRAALPLFVALFISSAAYAQGPPPPAPVFPPTPPAVSSQLPPSLPLVPLFTDSERAVIVGYWNAPGRYTVSAPPPPSPGATGSAGPWQVRLTPEGSVWLLAYQKAVAGSGKLPPTADARAANTEWETWLTARVAYDRWLAQKAADAANKVVQGKPVSVPVAAAAAAPSFPGLIPGSLLAVVGNPPSFARSVAPMQYTVALEEPGEIYSYTDNVKMRDRYAYYRFPQGVVSYDTQLKDMPVGETDALFKAAGFTPGEQHIFAAVSKLEGGFATTQTYDTGFVSIGFIQFVTLADGKADLSNVLRQMKTDDHTAFQADFHRFGFDVQTDNSLTVIDPATGAELTGNAAVLKIIDDKRLTAVFQRAGRRTPFRVAQIKVAKSYYWPENDPLRVTLADGAIADGKVSDVVRSEAGIATLLDRKINTGNIRLLADVVARIMSAHNLKTLADAAAYEREIITAMKYRTDFLADTTLEQPTAAAASPNRAAR